MFIKALLVLATLYAKSVLSSHGPTAQPVILQNGYLADTHEVAAAKSAHLATLSHRNHGYSHSGNHAYFDNHGYSHGDLRYHGPTAVPHVLHDGHIADTHEVSAAKAEHFAAVAKARNHEGHSGAHYGHSTPYYGLVAHPVLLHSGYLADNHEVSAAKAEHFAAVDKARIYGGNHGYAGNQGYSHGDFRYHGPTAFPPVLHDGHIADTHEVSAAKAEHFAAVAKARTYGVNHGYAGNHGYSHGDLRYHGPTAVPHVLHNGHIADTHEVSAAKAKHFAAVAKARNHGGYSGAHYGHSTPYYGLLAHPVLLHSGYLADIHEVAVTKQHHLHAPYSSHSRHHHGIHQPIIRN